MEPEDDILRAVLELDHRLDVLEECDSAAPAPETWESFFEKYGERVPGADLGLTVADHSIAAVAGLAGGLLDISRMVSGALENEDIHQRLDRVWKERMERLGGGTPAIDNVRGGPAHRLVGPTHDIARFFEALKSVREGRFNWNVLGMPHQATAYRDGVAPYVRVESTNDAVFILVVHWMADFFSKMSLPIPMTTRLAEVNRPELVRSLVEAYKAGANLRKALGQFASNLSGIALISVLLHVYRYIDIFLVSKTEQLSFRALNLSSDIRFREMSRNANLIALAVSTVKAGVTQDPFTMNYAAFFKFCADGHALNVLVDKRIDELELRVDRILNEFAD